ncbi:MAG: hypothetical protein U0821_19325 [Chloroflexota bacterium]
MTGLSQCRGGGIEINVGGPSRIGNWEGRARVAAALSATRGVPVDGEAGLPVNRRSG